MKLLVVEDERRLAQILAEGLLEAGYLVEVAFDGVEGQALALTGEFDVIILDLMLPRRDGLEICRELRRRQVDSAILMLTARDAVEDKVRGLDCGADDYLTKPFAFPEFLARVRSLLAVLEYLTHNAERVLTRDQILAHVWPSDYDGYSNTVDVFIRYLRRKIDDGREPKLIQTVIGSGYTLRAPD